jgi:hypothetical protein
MLQFRRNSLKAVVVSALLVGRMPGQNTGIDEDPDGHRHC